MTLIPRRRFLASTSAAAVTLPTVTTAMAAPPPSTAVSAEWKLLAVAPLSRKIPELESHYRRGVEAGLLQSEGLPVQLHWVGAHALPNAAARTIEAALDEPRTWHGVLGWMPPELERRVAAMTDARGLPLWVSDTGADLRLGVTTKHRKAQGYNSLNLCERAERLATEIIRNNGPRAVLALGWMESGYDFASVFQQAYRALGGQILGRHIGGPVEQAKEFNGLRRTILEHRPDAVVAFYSGPQAGRFAQWWRANAHMQGPWSLATLPLMDEATRGIATPRARASDWRAAFQLTGLSRSAASELGFEAGLKVGESISRLPLNASPDQIAQVWAQASSSEARAVGYPQALMALAAAPQPSSSGWLNGYLQT